MREQQRHIIEALGAQPSVDAAAEIDRRVSFLARYARSVAGSRGFVLGISGGQDSTLAGRLCQLAVEQLRDLGVEAEFVAVRLPYGTQHDEDDAELALDFIRPDRTFVVNVQTTVDALVRELTEHTGESVSDFNKGNVKARARMMAQYAIAGDRRLIVVGTDHAAEAVTGFFTKFGDGAADVLPLAGLTKRQGASLLRHLGAVDRLVSKTPTADLLDSVPGRSDESELGIGYTDIDDYLEGKPVPDAQAELIESKYLASQHKRHLPVTPVDRWWLEG